MITSTEQPNSTRLNLCRQGLPAAALVPQNASTSAACVEKRTMYLHNTAPQLSAQCTIISTQGSKTCVC